MGIEQELSSRVRQLETTNKNLVHMVKVQEQQIKRLQHALYNLEGEIQNIKHVMSKSM